MSEKVTYVCMYYKREELDRMLIQSFIKSKGEIPNNIIFIDNSHRTFTSCAKAYNDTLTNYKNKINDVIIFIHPDIAFDNLDFENRIVEELEKNENQILGFAGITNGLVYTNLRYKLTKTGIAIPFDQKMECESLDECCFAMSKKLFFSLKFDENVCDGFHLYCVDLCYAAKLRFSTQSYILPEKLYHKENPDSGLYDDNNFIRAMYRLTRKYSKSFKEINTTCYQCPTSGLWRLIHLSCSYFHNIRMSIFGRLMKRR